MMKTLTDSGLVTYEPYAGVRLTQAGRKLAGFRSLPPADKDALLDVLYRLAQLAIDFPQFAEIEINPLRVLPTGEGTLAVDVRLRLAGV